MSKFKIGDRVRYIETNYYSHFYDKCGTVTNIDHEGVWVNFDGKELNDTEYFYDHRFELLTNNKTNNMSILSKIKQITRSEPEKTFVEVGFLNDNEEITEDGRAVLEQILWEQNKDKLKELADKLVEADKED